MTDAQVYLDLCGLKCPLPVIRTRKALASAQHGSVLVVTCTDPLAAIDIPHLLHETGNTLEASSSDGRIMTFTIRVTS